MNENIENTQFGYAILTTPFRACAQLTGMDSWYGSTTGEFGLREVDKLKGR